MKTLEDIIIEHIPLLTGDSCWSATIAGKYEFKIEKTKNTPRNKRKEKEQT